jgi:hypothetical protein
MDVLADSRILLQLLEPTDPLYTIIGQAVRLLHARGDRIVIAPQNVAEFWNVCTKNRRSPRRPTHLAGSVRLNYNLKSLAFPISIKPRNRMGTIHTQNCSRDQFVVMRRNKGMVILHNTCWLRIREPSSTEFRSD